MAGNRDWMKPTADQPYNYEDYQEVTPNADTVRYPAAGTEFTQPWDYFIVENKSAANIRIKWDANASDTSGQKLTAGQIGKFPIRAENYISIYGGDGTAIPVRFFRW